MDSVDVRVLRRRDLQELVNLGLVNPADIPKKYGSFRVLNEGNGYTNEPELQASMSRNVKKIRGIDIIDKIGDGTFDFASLRAKWLENRERGVQSFGDVVLSPFVALNTLIVSSTCESLSKVGESYNVRILFGNTFSWMIKESEYFEYERDGKILWKGDVEFGDAKDQADQFVEFVKDKRGVDLSKYSMLRSGTVGDKEVQFFIQKPIVSPGFKNMKIHCTCPFYRYYLAYANVFHSVDIVGKAPIVFNGRRAPSRKSYTRNKENWIGECKHIYYLISKLSRLDIVKEDDGGLDYEALRQLFDEFNSERKVAYAKKQLPPEVSVTVLRKDDTESVSAQKVQAGHGDNITVDRDWNSASSLSASPDKGSPTSDVTATEDSEPVDIKGVPKKKRPPNKVTARRVKDSENPVSIELDADGGKSVSAEKTDEETPEFKIPKKKPKTRKKKEEPREEPKEEPKEAGSVEVDEVPPEEDSSAGDFQEEPKKVEYDLNIKSSPLEIDKGFNATSIIKLNGRDFLFPSIARSIGPSSTLSFENKSELSDFHKSVVNSLGKIDSKYKYASDINASALFIRTYLGSGDTTVEQKRIASLSNVDLVIFVALNLTKDKIDFLVDYTSEHIEAEFAELANMVSDLLPSIYKPILNYTSTLKKSEVEQPPQVPPQVTPRATPRVKPSQGVDKEQTAQTPTTPQVQVPPQPPQTGEQTEEDDNVEGLKESLLW